MANLEHPKVSRLVPISPRLFSKAVKGLSGPELRQLLGALVALLSSSEEEKLAVLHEDLSVRFNMATLSVRFGTDSMPTSCDVVKGGMWENRELGL